MARRPALAPLLAVLAAGHALGASSWQLTSWPEVSGEAIRWLPLFTAQDAYVAVDQSAESLRLVRSFDSGETWERLGSAAPLLHADYVDLHVLPPARAGVPLWVTARDGRILELAPEDLRWVEVEAPGSGPAEVVYFADREHGFVARGEGSGSGSLLVTRDGGGTWTPRALDPRVGRLVKLRADTLGTIWALDAGGSVWRQDSSLIQAPFNAAEAAFLDSEAVALTTSFELYETSDAGRTWTRHETNLPDLGEHAPLLNPLLDLDYYTRDMLLLSTPHALLISEDRERWEVVVNGDSLVDRAVVNGYTGEIALGGRQVLVSRDRGRSFRLHAAPDFSLLARPIVPTVWGLDRGIIKSQDGGTRWQRLLWDGRVDHLVDLRFLDRSYGFVARADTLGPTLYRTTDGGGSFQIVDEGALLRGVRRIHPVDRSRVWATAENGLFRSQDGGVTWAQSASYPGVAPGAAHFMDALHGWVNEGTRLLRTVDGGSSWIELSPPEPDLSALIFVSPDSGFAAGAALHRTGDGGATWEGLAVAGGPWRALSAPERFTVWAAGDHGSLASCRDGWTLVVEESDLRLQSLDRPFLRLAFPTPEEGTTGAGAQLLRYTTDTSGPLFHADLVPTPFLERHVDLYFGARERLRGDSVEVRLDETVLPVAYIDPAGYFFRCHYTVPPSGVEHQVRITARDLAGNRRTTSVLFAAATGPLRIAAGGARLALAADDGSDAWGAMIEIDPHDLDPIPEEYAPLTPPFLVLAASGAPFSSYRIETARHPLARLAVHDGSEWRILAGSRGSLETALERFHVRVVEVGAGADPPPPPVSLWPNPAGPRIHLVLDHEPLDIEIVDVTGRIARVQRPDRSIAAGGRLILELNIRDLPAGVYWVGPHRFVHVR